MTLATGGARSSSPLLPGHPADNQPFPLAQVKDRLVPTLSASGTAGSLCQGCEGGSLDLLLLFKGVMYLGSPL